MSAQEEAELRAFVARERSFGMSTDELRAGLRDFHQRGLFERYAQIRRETPREGPSVAELVAKWRASPEWVQVRDALTRFCGDEDEATWLAYTKPALGVQWIQEGRREPLDVPHVAQVVWNQRSVGMGLGDVIVWAELQEQLEAEGSGSDDAPGQ